ncbi:hypothetical protein D3C86_1829330 [compost metagenome]
MPKDIICQLVELRILEWPHAVTNHIQRFFRHKSTQRVLKLRHTVQINKERPADLNNRVIARQQTDKIGKALGDSDIAQLAGIGHTREQHLVLITTAQHFLHTAHHTCRAVMLFHLTVERIAHHRAVKQPR